MSAKIWLILTRVSSETSFDSKQPKMESNLFSALSETKCLFRLFRFFTETASFRVSIEPKQKKDQPKHRKFFHILDQLGLNFNAISLKFWQLIGIIAVLNLWNFQIDSLQIKT